MKEKKIYQNTGQIIKGALSTDEYTALVSDVKKGAVYVSKNRRNIPRAKIIKSNAGNILYSICVKRTIDKAPQVYNLTPEQYRKLFHTRTHIIPAKACIQRWPKPIPNKHKGSIQRPPRPVKGNDQPKKGEGSK